MAPAGCGRSGGMPVMTRATVSDVPNQPKTPQRSVRVPDEVWARAKEKAEAQGITVSEVVREKLEEWLREV